MDSNLYIERVSRHLERKHTRRLENKENKNCNSREIFSGVKKKFKKNDNELVKIAKLKRIE